MNDYTTTRTFSAFLSFTFILLIAQGLVVASLTPVRAQERPGPSHVEREIHVQFAPETVSLPEGQTQASPQELTINVPALQEAFQRFGVERVAKTFPEFEPADTIGTTRTGEQVRLADVSRVFTLRLPSEAGIEEAVKRLKELPQVVFAERNGRSISQVTYPDDQYFDASGSPGSGGEQWNLLNTGQDGGTADADVDAPEAWDITTGSSNTVIGVIDSGVESGHPDLSGKVSGDAAVSDHGTHVAGIAAAKTDNSGEGIAGIDWNAQIEDQPGGGDNQATYNSIMDAVQGADADILNSSYILCNSCNNPVPDPRYSVLVRRAYANAYRMNVVSAAAMGNYNTSDVYYPAGYGQGIIAVGATNRDDQRWEDGPDDGSNTGSHIDVVAPGVNITSTVTYGYAEKTGTSMATPHISGIAGLLLAENSNLYNDDIEHIIRLSAEDVNSGTKPGFDNELGTGRVNARKALEYLQSPYAVKHWMARGGSSVETWDFVGTFYDLPGAPDGNYVGTTHRVRTTVSFPESFSSIEGVWGRGVASTGYSAATTNFSIPYCRVVSHTATSVTLETFVHNVSRIDGSYTGWYPVKPSNTDCAYTVLGEPGPPPLQVSLSGPGTLDSGETGTWTATVTGGSGSTSYDWDYSPAGTVPGWQSTSCSGASCNHTFYNSSESVKAGGMRVIVTKGTETDTAITYTGIQPSDDPGCSPTDPCIAGASLKRGPAVYDLQASSQGDAVRVQWRARDLSAEETSSFVVQHRADSTGAWSELGVVAAADSTAKSASGPGASYQFKTASLAVGVHQFRLAVAPDEQSRSSWTSEPVRARVKLEESHRLSAYPNPMRQRATVELAVKEAQEVTVRLYDVLGRAVTTLHTGPVPAQETKRLRLDASQAGLSSGTYFLRVRGAAFTATRQLTVVR